MTRHSSTPRGASLHVRLQDAEKAALACQAEAEQRSASDLARQALAMLLGERAGGGPGVEPAAAEARKAMAGR
jgi:predicted transcriptional regulator